MIKVQGTILFLMSWLLLCVVYVNGNSASWLSVDVDALWNNNANWTNPFPNADSDVAAFAGYGPGGGVLDSGIDITIGALYLDARSGINIQFTNNHTLTFSNSNSGGSNRAYIFVGASQSYTIDTPIILMNNLSFQAEIASMLTISQSITGPYSVTVVGDENSTIVFEGANNAYTGDTIIESGKLDIKGPTTMINIPGNVKISGKGFLNHASSGQNNNYAMGAQIEMQGGKFNLFDTTQTIQSLLMQKNASVESAAGAVLQITAVANTLGLYIGDNSLIKIDTIVMVNGGAIVNDFNSPGEGFINGSLAPSGSTTIDLNGNSNVPIFCANNPTQGDNEFDLDFVNVNFTNGSLAKSGLGSINLDGNGFIVDLAITQGSVQIGRQGSPASIDGSGSPSTITVSGEGVLQGFGTLGSSGNVSVVNDSGLVISGAISKAGSLTVSGDYQQNSNGATLIQGFDTSNVNELIVNDGGVTLAGTLIFVSQPFFADFSDGDEIVVIDNSGGSGITGTFDEFVAEVPSGLVASVVYTDSQVKVVFSTCLPQPDAPSNLRGSRIVNRFAVQQDVINQLEWDQSATIDVVGYRIYRDGVLVGIVTNDGPLIFQDHNRQLSTSDQYSVTAIRQESNPVTVTVS